MNHYRLNTIAFCLMTLLSVSAASPESLDANLEPLRPLIGKTFTGEFKNSTPEKPMVDVARWERALNGKAVRMVHSLNEGAYGGESFFTWDSEKKAIVYHYFTTAGFMTVGTLTPEKNKFTSIEKVVGSAGNVKEVRGTVELQKEGAYKVTTQYVDSDGKLTMGREVTYRTNSSAEVKFR